MEEGPIWKDSAVAVGNDAKGGGVEASGVVLQEAIRMKYDTLTI